jgi:hypothetical protein
MDVYINTLIFVPNFCIWILLNLSYCYLLTKILHSNYKISTNLGIFRVNIHFPPLPYVYVNVYVYGMYMYMHTYMHIMSERKQFAC